MRDRRHVRLFSPFVIDNLNTTNGKAQAIHAALLEQLAKLRQAA
jgi:hypothetical protein